MSTTPPVGTTKYFIGREEVPPQMDRIEALLTEIRDLLRAQQPGRFDGPTMGAAYDPLAPTPPYPPLSEAMLGDDARLAAMQAMPLPPKRGDGIYHVAGPNGELPDPQGTPGAINPDVTDDPAVLKATIGTPGWTATVRPSVAFSDALKAQISTEYGLTGSLSEYECDHLIPLCCGGHPTSQLNLWNQRRAGINGASLKDITEVLAQHAILAGHISLEEAQDGFRQDWTALHARLTSNPQIMHLMMAIEPPEPEP